MSTITAAKREPERITRPEQLNDCIRVIRPGIWISLGITLALLIAACVWAVFGYIETKTTTVAWSDPASGELTLFLRTVDAEHISERTRFRIGSREYRISSVDETLYEAVEDGLDRDLFDMALHISGIERGEWIRHAYAKSNLPEGLYEASVTLEKVHPIVFITN